MPRPSASVPPEAIRIEDEVWQEAFARREPSRPRRQLHVVEGGRRAAAPPVAAPTLDGSPATAPRTSAARRAATPVAAAPANRTAPASVTAAAAERSNPAAPAGGVPGRRTVTIRGYGAERNLPWPDASRGRPQRRVYERAGFQPDRVAMWAVLLGILLVIVAVASAHG